MRHRWRLKSTIRANELTDEFNRNLREKPRDRGGAIKIRLRLDERQVHKATPSNKRGMTSNERGPTTVSDTHRTGLPNQLQHHTRPGVHYQSNWRSCTGPGGHIPATTDRPQNGPVSGLRRTSNSTAAMPGLAPANGFDPHKNPYLRVPEGQF